MATEERTLTRRQTAGGLVSGTLKTLISAESSTPQRARAAATTAVGAVGVLGGASVLTEEIVKHGSGLFTTAWADGPVAAWNSAVVPGWEHAPVAISAAIGGTAIASALSSYIRNSTVDGEKQYRTDAERSQRVGIPVRNFFRTACGVTGTASAATALLAAGADHLSLIGLHDATAVGSVLTPGAEGLAALAVVSAVTARRWQHRAQRQVAPDHTLAE